jgi:hypothetical protein
LNGRRLLTLFGGLVFSVALVGFLIESRNAHRNAATTASAALQSPVPVTASSETGAALPPEASAAPSPEPSSGAPPPALKPAMRTRPRSEPAAPSAPRPRSPAQPASPPATADDIDRSNPWSP